MRKALVCVICHELTWKDSTEIGVQEPRTWWSCLNCVPGGDQA